jgi:hypothetical protein
MTCEECPKHGRTGTRQKITIGSYIIQGCDNPECILYQKPLTQKEIDFYNIPVPEPQKSDLEIIKEKLVYLEEELKKLK